MTADNLSKNRKVVRSHSLDHRSGLIVAIDHVVAKRDKVGCRHRTTGEGVRGQPATGEAIEAQGVQRFSIEDGRAAEMWTECGTLGLIGAVPASPAV